MIFSSQNYLFKSKHCGRSTKFNEFFTSILQVVSKTGEINAHEAVDLVIKNIGLNEEQLSLKQEFNGRPLAKNRVH